MKFAFRRIVASASNLLPHVPKEKPTWTDKKWSTQDRSTMTLCSETYFVEPLAWMPSITQSLQGKIHCPKCKSKLGSFSWIMGNWLSMWMTNIKKIHVFWNVNLCYWESRSWHSEGTMILIIVWCCLLSDCDTSWETCIFRDTTVRFLGLAAWIHTVYVIEYNVVINLKVGKTKFIHWEARSSDGASFKKILLLAEKDIISFLQVILRPFWNSSIGYLNFVLLNFIIWK